MSKNRQQRRTKSPGLKPIALQVIQGIFQDALDHHRDGRIDDAVVCYQRVLAFKPDHADAHSNLGTLLWAQGRIDEAVTHYERALLFDSGHANAHNNLGLALVQRGKIGDGIAHYERALVFDPGHANAHNNLGVALAGKGRVDEAAAHYRRALALKPGFVDAHNNLGNLLAGQGKNIDAIEHYKWVLSHEPDHAEAHNNLGNVLKYEARLDDAMARYDRAIAIRPDYAEAHFNRSELRTFHHGDADLAALEALAGRDDLSAKRSLHVHFALAKALDDVGDYARAFECLRKANALKRGQIVFDEDSLVERFERIRNVFDSSLFDRFQGEGDPSSTPIFVLGMPRSGSTLIEQALAGHPQIHGAGELPDLEIALAGVLSDGGRSLPWPECVPDLDGAALREIGQAYLARLPALADGNVRIVDKTPGNFFNIGLIRLILPNARIIHTMRDPIDTCVSCYSKLFTSGQSYSYDLAELGRFYRCYNGLMAHWRSVLPWDAMLDVSYEDVVDDLEGQVRRMINYCGLPWDDRCIGFHTNSRPVRTASAVQVRQPLFRGSLQRWRKYEAGLAPLLRELGDLGSAQVKAKGAG